MVAVVIGYAKKDRELAAMICAIAASNDSGFLDARNALGVHWTSDAALLAHAAFDHVYPFMHQFSNACLFGECEALIRSGWIP